MAVVILVVIVVLSLVVVTTFVVALFVVTVAFGHIIAVVVLAWLFRFREENSTGNEVDKQATNNGSNAISDNQNPVGHCVVAILRAGGRLNNGNTKVNSAKTQNQEQLRLVVGNKDLKYLVGHRALLQEFFGRHVMGDVPDVFVPHIVDGIVALEER